jgi:hypothetical protein
MIYKHGCVGSLSVGPDLLVARGRPIRALRIGVASSERSGVPRRSEESE